jgi:hypothetical protein
LCPLLINLLLDVVFAHKKSDAGLCFS